MIILCKTVLDVEFGKSNSTNGDAEVDLTSLLLLTSVTFSCQLTRSTDNKRRMISRGFRKPLHSSGDEHLYR